MNILAPSVPKTLRISPMMREHLLLDPVFAARALLSIHFDTPGPFENVFAATERADAGLRDFAVCDLLDAMSQARAAIAQAETVDV